VIREEIELTPDEFSGEQSLVHIMIVESIQVPGLAVVLPVSSYHSLVRLKFKDEGSDIHLSSY